MVSTETQAKKGESLNTQKTHIIRVPRLVSPELAKAVKNKIRLNRRKDLKRKGDTFLLKRL